MADKLLTSQEWLYSISYLVITRTSEIPSKQSIEPFHVDDNYILLASVHEITSYARKTKSWPRNVFWFYNDWWRIIAKLL